MTHFTTDLEIVGIGQCCWDYLAAVDSYPAVDAKSEISAWAEQGGGPVATALVTLSRLGKKCRFHGITGDDLLGERIRHSLLDEDIDVTGLVIRPDASSQVAFIVVEGISGRRTVFWQRPTGQELRPEELGKQFLDRCGILLLDGLMAEVSLYAAHEAKKRGIPVMLDAGRMRPGILDIARLSDYVIAGEQFAIDLGWQFEPKPFMEAAQTVEAPVVTVTRGELGSLTSCAGEIIDMPAFKVNAVDTTGAGDVFHGAFAFGVLQKWELRQIIRFASTVAALKCRELGGRRGIPSLREVMGILGAAGYMEP